MNATNELAPRYLDTRQAAAYLGLSSRMLRTMRAEGEGPPYARAGRRVIYDRLDLDDWVARRKQGPDSEKARNRARSLAIMAAGAKKFCNPSFVG